MSEDGAGYARTLHGIPVLRKVLYTTHMRTVYEAYKNRIRNERLFHPVPIPIPIPWSDGKRKDVCVPQPLYGMSYLFYLPLAPHLKYT